MWAIPFASRSTLAGPSSPGTSTGSAAAPRASRPAGRSRDRVRTTMMARRIEATSPGTGSQLPEHWLPQASSEPGEAYQSGPITSPGGGAGYTHGAMTRLRVPGWPWSVVAAVVVVVLVGGGLFALGGEGGSGDRPGAVGGGGSGDGGTTPGGGGGGDRGAPAPGPAPGGGGGGGRARRPPAPPPEQLHHPQAP